VIKGADFERINGFPNFWGWGNEDSVFQKRCLRGGLHIDRSHFYKIGSPEILQLFDGVSRLISPREHAVGKADSGVNGLTSVYRITYSVDKESLNPEDNRYVVENARIQVINIYTFLTETRFEKNDFYEYDLRDSTRTIVKPQKPKTEKRVVTTDDWQHIPERRSHSSYVGQGQSQGQGQGQSQGQGIRKPISPSEIYSAQYALQIGAKQRAAISSHVNFNNIRKK
jgi:hypothetical protein